jgi:hypothetical protein
MVRFYLEHQSDARIEVFDSVGRSVYGADFRDLSAGIHQLPVAAAQLPSGFYLLRISVNGSTEVRRFMVQ